MSEFKPKRRASRLRLPEQAVKRDIFTWLRLQKQFTVAWNNYAGGIYDPVQKRFLKRNSPWDVEGTSDIIGCWMGRFLAIEVKIPEVRDHLGRVVQRKSYPTEAQDEFIRRVTALGGIAFVARSVHDVVARLQPDIDLARKNSLGLKPSEPIGVSPQENILIEPEAK